MSVAVVVGVPLTWLVMPGPPTHCCYCRGSTLHGWLVGWGGEWGEGDPE